MNNPLKRHSNAKFLAIAALCAGQQQHFWEMHDRLFEIEDKSESQVLKMAQELLLDADLFQKCLGFTPDVAANIDHDRRLAESLQMTATPSFAIGVADNNGIVTVHKFILGARSLDTFEKAIEEVDKGLH